MAAHMREQVPAETGRKPDAGPTPMDRGSHPTHAKAHGDHGAAWMLLYLLAAAAVAALVWVLFGWGA